MIWIYTVCKDRTYVSGFSRTRVNNEIPDKVTYTWGQVSFLAQTGLLHRFFKRILAFYYNSNTSDGHKNVQKLLDKVQKKVFFTIKAQIIF